MNETKEIAASVGLGYDRVFLRRELVSPSAYPGLEIPMTVQQANLPGETVVYTDLSIE